MSRHHLKISKVVSMSAFLGKSGRSGGTKNAQEQSFPCTRITSAVFLLSRFYRNDQSITEPFTSSHSSTMLLGDIRGHYVPKLPVERSAPLHSTTEELLSYKCKALENCDCSIRQKILTGFPIMFCSVTNKRNNACTSQDICCVQTMNVDESHQNDHV